VCVCAKDIFGVIPVACVVYDRVFGNTDHINFLLSGGIVSRNGVGSFFRINLK
jgi:hypothetical protein